MLSNLGWLAFALLVMAGSVAVGIIAGWVIVLVTGGKL